MKKKIFSIICIICYCVLLTSINKINGQTRIHEEVSNNTNSMFFSETENSSEIYLFFEIQSYDSINGIVNIIITINDDLFDDINYSITINDSLTEIISEPNNFVEGVNYIQIRCNNYDENISYLSISRNDEDGAFDFEIYYFRDDLNTYLGFSSFLEIRESRYEDLTDTQKEEVNYSSFIYNGSLQLSNLPPYITISGELLWKDTNNVVHPARHLKVEIMDANLLFPDEIISTVYTNDLGIYSATFLNDNSFFEHGYDIYRKIYPDSEYFSVLDANSNPAPYVTPTLTDTINDHTDITHIFNYSNEMERRVQIHQALYLAELYLSSILGNTYFDELKIVYNPNSHKSIYDESVNKIYLYGDDYRYYDEVMYFYGLYAQHLMNFSNGYFNPDYLYGNYEDYTGTYSKDSGTKIAWSTGFAIYFATAAQLTQNASSLNIPGVGDTNFDSSVELFPLQPVRDADKHGEGGPIGIAGLLLDLADSNTIHDWDVIYLGYNFWVSIIQSYHPNTFSEFFIRLRTVYPSISDDGIGNLLTNYELAPNIYYFETTSFSFYTPKTVTFALRGDSLNYVNDSFILNVKTSNGINVLTTESFNKSPNDNLNGHYTFTTSQWTSILQYSGQTLIIRITGYQTSTPTTGPYLSKGFPFVVPTPTTITLGSVSNYLNTNGIFWYKFISPSSGAYSFTTTGTTDTFGDLFSSVRAGYNSSTGAVSSNDNSGTGNNFLVSTDLLLGQIIFLRVRGSSAATFGTFTLTVTQTSTHTHSYNDHYTYYNTTTHNAYCSCGNFISQNHTNRLGNSGSSGNVCLCGYAGGWSSFISPHSHDDDSDFTEESPYSFETSSILYFIIDEEKEKK